MKIYWHQIFVLFFFSVEMKIQSSIETEQSQNLYYGNVQEGEPPKYESDVYAMYAEQDNQYYDRNAWTLINVYWIKMHEHWCI